MLLQVRHIGCHWLLLLLLRPYYCAHLLLFNIPLHLVLLLLLQVSHMAPELLRFGKMSPAVDVFSFGIMSE
jgi:hypothetical protein